MIDLPSDLLWYMCRGLGEGWQFAVALVHTETAAMFRLFKTLDVDNKRFHTPHTFVVRPPLRPGWFQARVQWALSLGVRLTTIRAWVRGRKLPLPWWEHLLDRLVESCEPPHEARNPDPARDATRLHKTCGVARLLL